MDQNDPLWIAVLKRFNGDKDSALKALEDPDSLMKYPEIRALIEGGDSNFARGDDSQSVKVFLMIFVRME